MIQRRHNRPAVDKRTPRERARDTLRALAAQNPQTTEELKTACITIAGCLRGYVASTTAIPAYDLTTNELARQLKLNDIPADWITGVIDVLRVCDSVKFARDVLELTTIHGMTHATELLVEQYPPASAQSASPQVKQTQLNGVTA